MFVDVSKCDMSVDLPPALGYSFLTSFFFNLSIPASVKTLSSVCKSNYQTHLHFFREI